MTKYNNLENAIAELWKRGFKEQYKYRDGQLIEIGTEKVIKSSEVEIVEYHRFRKTEDRGNAAIVFALVTNLGKKGLIATTYNSNKDTELLEFMDKVKIKVPEKLIKSSR